MFFNGKDTIKTTVWWFNKHYPNFAPGKLTIIDWFAEFKHGRMNTDDALLPGCLKEVVTLKNIVQVYKIILANCQVKLHKIADTLNISEEYVGFIFHVRLFMRKPSPKWVPHLQTMHQKRVFSHFLKFFLTFF